MSFFDTYNWDTDVAPMISAWLAQDVIKWGILSIIAISVATLAGRAFISVFFKRE